RIDRHGQSKAPGGRMELAGQRAMTLGKVIRASLPHFSFGTDPDGYQSMSLSGEVDLIKGLPVRGIFHEMKIRWKGGQAPQFSLREVQVVATQPGVFLLDGAVQFVTQGAGESAGGLSAHGFNGALRLGLRTAGLEPDGQLAVREV